MPRWLSAALSAIAVTIALLLVAPLLSLVFGFRIYVVTSGSMEPTARVGDAIVLRRSPADVGVGDVVTFRPLREGGVRTHRVVSIHDIEGEGRHLRTKGDANPTEDPDLVPVTNVLGRVAAVVPHVGREYLWATTPWGRMVLVGVPVLLIVAREMRSIFRPTGGRRSSRVRRPRPLRLRTATISVATVVATAVAGPGAASFSDSAPVGTNTLASGQVDAPTSLNGSAQLIPCRVNLSWTAPASGLTPDGYDILRSTTSGGPYTFRKHVTATSGADDTGPLSALTTYYYVVRSTRSAWTSPNSAQRAVTTLLCAL
jgi:signal peptidase